MTCQKGVIQTSRYCWWLYPTIGSRWENRSASLDICSILPIGAVWMALRVQTQISGDVFILRCHGRIVFGDEGAALRERVGNMLAGSPRIVINLKGVDHIDSGGSVSWLDSLSRRETEVANSS